MSNHQYKYELVPCPYCDKMCKSNGLHRHVKTHGEELYNQYQKSKEVQCQPKVLILSAGKYQCAECDFQSESKQSVSSHWWRNHTESGKAHNVGVVYPEGKVAWNKGLTQKDHPSLARPNQKGKKFGAALTGHTEDSIRKISEKLSINNKGGRAKWYDVSGQRVQGTWERDVALKLDELKIKWIKLKTNRDILKYEMEGKIRSYTPDFFLEDYNVYLEIKGFWWGNDKEKMRIVLETHTDKNIFVVEKEQFDRIMQGELVWSFQRLPEEQKN